MSSAGGDAAVTVRILVVDDHPVFRTGLAALFNAEPGLAVCAEAGSIAEAVAAVSTERPEVAVIDLALGRESGLDLLAWLTQFHPMIRVLVLSTYDEQVYAERALRAGALGYAMKNRTGTELVSAVRRVAAGKACVSAEVAERLLSMLSGARRSVDGGGRSPMDRLSDRERHVFALVGNGLATREIAEQLKVSVKTVETHCAHLKEKLGARNGRQLLRLAICWADRGSVGPGAPGIELEPGR